jgi:hypothetical protein
MPLLKPSVGWEYLRRPVFEMGIVPTPSFHSTAFLALEFRVRLEWRHGPGFPGSVLSERVIKIPTPMAALGNSPMTPTDGAATRLKSRQNPTDEDTALI